MSTGVKTYTLDTNGKLAPLTIEVDILRRLPAIVIVGVPASASRELAEIVRSAILNSGYDMPRQRIVVNVAPADMHKQEPYSFALPIAMGILHASKQVSDKVLNYAFIGQLGLTGILLPSRGMLTIAKPYAMNHTGRATDELVLQHDAAQLAADTFGDNLGALAARTLRDAVALAEGGAATQLTPAQPDVLVSYRGRMLPCWWPHPIDTSDIVLTPENESLIGSLIEAAATRCPVLFQGPPGCGATMLAARMPGLLGPMTNVARCATALIRDRAGLVGSSPYVRPFRAPHHTISVAGMLGDVLGRPGEIELAHEGVLFLDEMHEFPRHVLDTIKARLQGAVPAGCPRTPGVRPWLIGKVPDRIGPDDGSEFAADMQRRLDARVGALKATLKAASGQDPMVLTLSRSNLAGMVGPTIADTARWPNTPTLAQAVRQLKHAIKEDAYRTAYAATPADLSALGPGMHEPVGGAYPAEYDADGSVRDND